MIMKIRQAARRAALRRGTRGLHRRQQETAAAEVPGWEWLAR